MIKNLLSLNFLVPFTAAKSDFTRAIRGLRGMPRRLLLIGSDSTVGTTPIVQSVSSEARAIELYGRGSMLHAMWVAARRNADLGLQIDCIGVPALSAETVTNRVSTFSFVSGTSLGETGEIALYIGGVRIGIPVTATDTSVTNRVVAAVNSMPDLPVSAYTYGLYGGQVGWTNRCAGSAGTQVDIRVGFGLADKPIKNLTFAPGSAMGGAARSLTATITALSGYRATGIACGLTDAAYLPDLVAELSARWEATSMQDGQLVVAMRGSEATLSDFAKKLNSPHVCVIGTTGDMTSPWETAAAAAAAIESAAAIDPAEPVTGIVLKGYRGPAPGAGFTVDQANNLLVAGCSPLQIAPDGSGALLRMVTTYTSTPSGAADRSMSELAWIKTMSYYRWLHVSEFETKFRGYKLAQYITEPIPGQRIMTAELGAEIMLGLYQRLMDAGLVQNLEHYQRTLVVEVDGPNGKLRIQDEPVIITQHYQTEVTSYVVAGQV